MYKRVSAAFFVWGGICLIMGIVYLNMSGDFAFAGISALFLGIGLISGGVGRAIYVSNYNKNLNATEGSTLQTQCHVCNHVFCVPRSSFRPHRRNFPEGYVYCPSCKKPISIRNFKAVE